MIETRTVGGGWNISGCDNSRGREGMKEMGEGSMR